MAAAQLTNGLLADALLSQARERLAKGEATEIDRLMLVMEALSKRNLEATNTREEFKVKLFGREWSASEMIFGFGFVIAAEGGLGIAAMSGAFGGG